MNAPLHTDRCRERGHVSLSADAYARLRRAADQAGMSMSAFLDWKINSYLDRRGWQ